jgi:hypothetical protein
MSPRIHFDIPFFVLVILRRLFPPLRMSQLMHRSKTTDTFSATCDVLHPAPTQARGHIFVVASQPIVLVSQGPIVESISNLEIV